MSGQWHCWEPWPQEQVQRHAGIGYELVQALHAPVLQMVEQLPDVHHFFATCLPSRLSMCPRSSSRTSLATLVS